MPRGRRGSTPRLASGLTVLTEQSSRRGGSNESPPPPPAPRVTSKSSRNGLSLQESKHTYSDSKHTHLDSKHESKHSHHQQWKRYTDSPGVGSPPPPPAPAPGSPTQSRRERRASPHGSSSGKEKSGKGARGVPQSFGYFKRNGSGVNGAVNGGTNGQPVQVIQNQSSGKTASVSAVPRTKVKVSGGTQTCSSDLQQSHKASPPQFKSYSLTGNTANQLSQSVRERLMMGSQSLPKGAGGAHQDYGLVMRQVRPKASDGSLSDTQAIENTSPYAPWLRHSNTYSVAPRLSETDSMESLTSLPGHRSSLTHTRLLRDSPSRLSRSNSIRSTKSEKLYPSMMHRNTEPEAEPYYCLPIGSLSHWSQPTSPAPGSARTFPLSPTHSSTPRHSLPKNDDVHGSSISLVSTASSLYSSAEEKQAHEIRKLRRELTEAQEKVHTLTSQLSTNTQELENTQEDDTLQSEILSNEDSSNTHVEPSRDTVTNVLSPRQETSSNYQCYESQSSRDTVRQLVPPVKKTLGKRSAPSDPQIDEAFKAIKALTGNRAKRDSFDVYGEHVANKLRTYNALIRANVEHKINCLLHDADMQMLYQSQGQFNQRTTVSTASSSSYPSPVPSPYSSESLQHAVLEPQEPNFIDALLVSQEQKGDNFTEL